MHSIIDLDLAPRRIATALLTAAALLGIAPAAAHADAGQCRLSVSEPTVDFGRSIVARHGEAEADGNGPKLGSRESRLLATCDGDSRMSIVFRAADAGRDALAFGNYGVYTVTVVSARLDGQAVDVGKAASAGEIPLLSQVQPTLSNGDVVVPMRGSEIPAGQTLELALRLDAFMRPGVSLSDEAELDDAGYFELIAR